MKTYFKALLLVSLFFFIFQWGNVTASATDVKKDYFYYKTQTGIKIGLYQGSEKELIIPSMIDGLPVTQIDSYAFYNKGLTSVTIPDTVIEIEEYAFGDNQLREVVIPSSVKSLGDYVFEWNHLEKITFKGPIKLSKKSLDLSAWEKVFVGWYTDTAYKKKWSNTISAPTTIYGKWNTTLAVKKIKIDNLGNRKIALSNLDEIFTYTIYKDPQLKQKLTSFQAYGPNETLTVKEIGNNAGQVYVVASYSVFSSKPQQVKYPVRRASAFPRKNVTVKYAKNQSTIQLQGLKKGTTYTIYKDANRKVKIASFKANKTTRTIKTKQVTRKQGEVYVTAQESNYRVSPVTIACYPKNFICPKTFLPKGAQVLEREHDMIRYAYTKSLPGGGKITEIVVIKKEGRYLVMFDGVDKKGGLLFGKRFFDTKKKEMRTLYIWNNPVLTNEGHSAVSEIADEFLARF
ncbi:MAG: leucine-rich repeat domain-containing protein [Lysinibacillus sp.]